MTAQTSNPTLQIIICCGLFRAASTWAFNVTADIARSRSKDVRAIFADDVTTVAAQAISGTMIVKCHVPTPDMRLIVNIAKLTTVVSVRDPLDSVASLMEQFGESFDKAFADVAASADAVLAMLGVATTALILFYEDEGARSSVTVQKIADHLGIKVPADFSNSIAHKYRPEAVRAYIEATAAAWAFDKRLPREQFDPETHWHPGHLGSGVSNRHTAIMNPAQIAAVTYVTRRFRERFNYAAIHAPLIASGLHLAFSGEGLAYCERGFSCPEEWGVWTANDEARLLLPLAARAGALRLTLHCGLAPIFMVDSGASADISVNGTMLTRIVASPTLPDRIALALAFNAKGAEVVELVFLFAGLVEVDPRRLGFSLCTLDVHYTALDVGANT